MPELLANISCFVHT